MPILYIIRHQEPELRGRFIGRTDPPLTAAGRQIAHEQLAGITADIVYVSPRLRAQQTAEAIGGDAPRVVLPELAEIDFGEWEGLTWEEIEQRWPDTAGRKVEDWMGVTPPGGEAWPGFHTRVSRALDRILAGPMPAAVVAHMVVNAVLCERLFGTDPKHFHQPYGAVIPYAYSR
jgi:broad specificity phosphatase PhoE